MADERDIYVLVPDPSGDALLVAGETLPCVRGGRGVAGAIQAVREAYDLDAPYLRLGGLVGHGFGRQPVAALHEFDAPQAAWRPPAGLGWAPLAGADPASLAPAELAGAVERWLSEQLGGSVPEQRAPWARTGWLAEATRWMEARAVEHGLRPGGAVQIVQHWPISSVLRLETDGGGVYLKAVFSIFGHEPALTDALTKNHPDLVPDVLAVDEGLGWILMRELHGTPVGDLEYERWTAALPIAASIQLDWVGRQEELFALGAHDRTLAALEVEIGAALDAVGLPRAGVATELERRCAELARGPLPQTLVHGDLHPWNVMADGDRLRIFDWSDACVSHPFFDLPTFLQRCEDASAQKAMVDAYLDAWTGRGRPGELMAAYELAQPLACVHHAISYLRITEALEPNDRWLFTDEPGRWLARAAELLETS